MEALIQQFMLQQAEILNQLTQLREAVEALEEQVNEAVYRMDNREDYE